MKFILSFLFIATSCFTGFAQVSFTAPTLSVKKSATTDKHVQLGLTLTAATAGNTVEVRVMSSGTTLPASDYVLHHYSFTVATGQTTHNCYLQVFQDSLSDRDRMLRLEIVVTDTADAVITNTTTNNQMIITVKSAEEPLDDFEYLAYIGTNFDLVDGIRAKNLFFATSIFMPAKQKKHGWGAFLNLYGNRTVTFTDTTHLTNRTYQVTPYNADSSMHYRETADQRIEFSSDNLGAYFSPLFNLGEASTAHDLKLFLAPSFEFIWRRTNATLTYQNRTPGDTVVLPGAVQSGYTIPDELTIKSNQFAFNFGAGFFLCNENPTKRAMFRLYFATGVTRIYIPGPTGGLLNANPIYKERGDIFFSGRLWITERISGITIQAEVMNTMKQPTPYYGVTLSKAIGFHNIGKFFSPIGR